MRKLLMFTAIAVLVFFNVNAQEVAFGVKAGVNIASLTGDLEDLDSRTSFHVGGVAEVKFADKFSVQPELLYTSMGAKEEYSEDGYSGSVKLILDYISLPISAKYYVSEGLSVEVGPQVGFLVSAKGKYEESYAGETYSESEDIKDDLKSVDFGLNFGLGYKLPIGLNFAVRYGLGVANIADEDGVDTKNRVVQLSVGYMF